MCTLRANTLSNYSRWTVKIWIKMNRYGRVSICAFRPFLQQSRFEHTRNAVGHTLSHSRLIVANVHWYQVIEKYSGIITAKEKCLWHCSLQWYEYFHLTFRSISLTRASWIRYSAFILNFPVPKYRANGIQFLPVLQFHCKYMVCSMLTHIREHRSEAPCNGHWRLSHFDHNHGRY